MIARSGVDIAALVARVRDGDPAAVARLISLAEGDAPARRAVAAALALTGRPRQVALGDEASAARVVGITGSPGVGKSTLTSALVTELRNAGKRVGVLAVDPSSPISGGALLGDRVRMPEHATDQGVFIRSMAARGELGGLAASIPQALRVLDLAGCDVILVETVGVGQSEFQIASMADTTVLLLAPGLGDSIQAAKAGILEVADIFVVNKADRDGAGLLARELQQMRSLSDRAGVEGWRAPVLSTIATLADGVAQLWSTIVAHQDEAVADGDLERRRRQRAATEIEAIVLGQVRARLADLYASGAIDDRAEQVRTGCSDPYVAADELVSMLFR